MPKKGFRKKNPTPEALRQRRYQDDSARKRRAARMRARRQAVKDGRVKPGDGKEVDHVRPLSSNGGNSKSNTRIVSRKKNRQGGAAIANRRRRAKSKKKGKRS